MTNNHPINPRLSLINQWWDEAKQNAKYDEPIGPLVATRAAQWGADQELEACLLLVGGERRENLSQVIALRNSRRPKPPSLKEQALTALYAVATGANDTREQHQDLDTIRRALEALPE
jgi:hypothetical protein